MGAKGPRVARVHKVPRVLKVAGGRGGGEGCLARLRVYS